MRYFSNVNTLEELRKQYYSYGCECILTEETKKEIADRKREYIENAPQYPYRVVKKRVRKLIQ